MRNALSVDVEEYFHPAEVPASADPARWSYFLPRLPGQIARILDLLHKREVKATFFVLGWVAERQPGLVRRIAEAGHEIGCHSYAHQLIYNLTPLEFRRDTERALKAIENACGARPRLYRAPSYSITRESLWALDVLAECGITYDSSIYPIAHDRCGIPGFGRNPQMLQTASGWIYEIPAPTVRLACGRIAPAGGGGYLRLLPYAYTAAGIRRINHRDGMPACVYFHPWEIDEGIPRLTQGLLARARTYTGLCGMQKKLERLLEDFEFSSITSIYPVPAGFAASAPAPVNFPREERASFDAHGAPDIPRKSRA
jgi:polysaccharide deacetylase family protein (PEP-CTERM system associated)